VLTANRKAPTSKSFAETQKISLRPLSFRCKMRAHRNAPTSIAGRAPENVPDTPGYAAFDQSRHLVTFVVGVLGGERFFQADWNNAC
jgi:hypothetical protein